VASLANKRTQKDVLPRPIKPLNWRFNIFMKCIEIRSRSPFPLYTRMGLCESRLAV
jgi:hypothetical protein